jgi:hypothetical protein
MLFFWIGQSSLFKKTSLSHKEIKNSINSVHLDYRHWTGGENKTRVDYLKGNKRGHQECKTFDFLTCNFQVRN